MRGFVAVALVGAVALTACGGSSADEPRTLPSASPASPSPVATPTGKDAPTAQGAEAFARYYYAQISAAFLEKNPRLLVPLATPSCKVCETYVESVTALRDNGERVDRFDIRVQFVAATAVTAGRTRVDVGWSAPAVTRFDASGKVISKEEGLRGVEEQLDLVRDGDAWKVSDYKRIRVRG